MTRAPDCDLSDLMHKFVKAALAVLLTTGCGALAADPFALVGTVTNTTVPGRPTAPVRMAFGADGACVLTISPPLFGSGTCTLRQYDAKSGHLEIISKGDAEISWSGTVNGAVVAGTYRVGLQSGSFRLTMVAQPGRNLDTTLSSLKAALAASPAGAPSSCFKVGDTITVRGVFVPRNSGLYFMPHAFPYRPFCVDFKAATGPWNRTYVSAYEPGPEGLLYPIGYPQNELRPYVYVEVTGAIGASEPIEDPNRLSYLVRMPTINISKAVNVDADVRHDEDVWLADCKKWQKENLPAFAKQLPGATIEGIPAVDPSITVWVLINPQPCAMSGTPVSNVMIPPPQPVVLVRPEQ